MQRKFKCEIWGGVAVLIALCTPAIAQLPSNSLPVFITDQRVLVGRYHYEEKSDNFKIDVHLNADNTAPYRITTGPADSDFIKAEGFWTVDGGVIHIHNRPSLARLDPIGSPTLDPKVAISVTATNADGTPAEGLGVTWPNASGLYAMGDGRHVNRAAEKVPRTRVSIMRLADRTVLAMFDFDPRTANSFRFTYHPSDVEPFDIPAIALDPRAQTLEVEVGTASAKLRRVAD
ncbi:hypothetical protein [Sphingomonas sp. GB1N7]|uniref:hypothetical protein n=1 Tax=Parasphingomonas caseinilytica TaxID=3096158 RepID=UPI002FCBB03F